MTSMDAQPDLVSLNDFSDKCRICLKNYAEMIDIFSTGISSKIMEVTNLKMSWDDKLPRKMCQDCDLQVNELHKFQCLAKDSDQFLRKFLNVQEVFNDTSDKNICMKSTKKKKTRLHGNLLKNAKASKETLIKDKMYLILVSNGSNNSTQNEICIRDLDEENENAELTNFCKLLIKNQCDDNVYLNNKDKPKTDLTKHNNGMGEYNVNLFIYDCSKCNESYELEESFIHHLKNCHKTEGMNESFCYVCPICLNNESNKIMFLNHLKNHKRDGFLFFKVDKFGNHKVLLTEFEKEIFEVPKLTDKSIISNRIYKMNTSCYKCSLCKKIESVSSIIEHLKICYSDLKSDDFFPYVKYICPACNESWTDDVGSINAHFSCHRKDNVFFVKVNSFGQSIDPTNDIVDGPFTQFEKALEEVLNFDERRADGIKIFKLLNFLLCTICGFEADSFSSLDEHYNKIHEEVMPTTELFCPVCRDHFTVSNLDDCALYLKHLMNHKADGIDFLKIDKNGSILKAVSGGSSLFTDPKEIINGNVKCPLICDVDVAEVFPNRSADDCFSDSMLTSKESVISQFKIDVAKNREYVCEKCGRKCFGRGNYKRHFTTHTEKSKITASGSKRPSCTICNKSFSNRASLKEHRKHHAVEESDAEIDKKMCEICGRRLSNNTSLAKHRRQHLSNTENTLLKCKICERGFRREAALNRHISHHLNPNYFECEVCKLPLPTLASLQRHKLWHEGSPNTHDCKVCKLSFLTKDRLTAHQTHTGHHQDRKRFECNVCHERFFVGREFSQHIKLHPKYKMSECSLCGKRLSTMQSLMLHLSRHFESNSILCPHCGKQFFEERNYHRHLLTHKGVKPFACDFDGCKKSFYTYFELNRHKKYHNNTRDFSCPYCPKSFHEANHLKVHIRTHTGERPYTCPHCNKGFVTRTRCKQHINLIHQGVGCDLIQSNISKKVAVFEALETVA